MLNRKSQGYVGVAALLGGLAGFAVAAPRASACECSNTGWPLVRESVTSNGGATSHERHWPLEGMLSAYPGHAHVWLAPRGPETIHLVTTSP